jgi:hypothetical protein
MDGVSFVVELVAGVVPAKVDQGNPGTTLRRRL